jgi:hypothetical protein
MIPAKLVLSLLAVVLVPAAGFAQNVLVKPYVQPGDGSALEGADVKVIAWLTDQTPGEFTVEFGTKGALTGKAKPERVALDFAPMKVVPTTPPPAPKPGASKLSDAATTLEDLKAKVVKESSPPIPEKAQHYFKYAAKLEGLAFNTEIFYRVKLGEKMIREGSFKTRATADQPVRFVLVGDMASGKPEQNGIAFQIGKVKPDFLVALGDIVYSSGRVSQYLHHFWTSYNDVAAPSATVGAPLMRSIPFYPVIGNHDATAARLPETPDALGAFYFFHGPLNGPGAGPWNTPLGKDEKTAAAFRAAAGTSYPALNVYSFDNGPAHIVALDSNNYTKEMADDAFEQVRPWLEKDLRASKARWKIVCFHAPAFHTSKEHFVEQKMRLFEPVFEETGVDLVFAGHVHNYQRSKPLRFTPKPPVRDPRGRVNGEYQLDEQFDGVKNTRPNGVIHIVSGGGGAKLYSVDFEKTVEQLKQDNPGNWVPFTTKYVADRHSFSVVDLKPNELTLRQIDIAGKEIDRMVITKP